jgi:hypothetical protein
LKCEHTLEHLVDRAAILLARGVNLTFDVIDNFLHIVAMQSDGFFEKSIKEVQTGGLVGHGGPCIKHGCTILSNACSK